jgi:hypothetical protein
LGFHAEEYLVSEERRERESEIRLYELMERHLLGCSRSMGLAWSIRTQPPNRIMDGESK